MIDLKAKAGAVELLERIADRERRGDSVRRPVGFEPVCIESLTARRMREIEAAADIRPGSVMKALLAFVENWWSADEDGGRELENWVIDCNGWKLKSRELTRRNLHTLRDKWAKEDAQPASASQAGPMKKIRLSIPREMAVQLSRINWQIQFKGIPLRVTNARCAKPLPADRLLVTVWLPGHLVARFKVVAANCGETLARFALMLIYQAVETVALTSEDFRQVADDMRRAECEGVHGNSHRPPGLGSTV